jgi:regulatory protein
VPQITAIKPQKNKKRINIYLDGKFGFGIDYESFVKLNLKVEQNLTQEEIEKIVKEAEFQKVKDKLLRYATIRPRSEKETGDWMKRKKVHKSIKKDLFDTLKRLELIDDRKFASWWIDQRLQFKPRGKKALYSELMKKGVGRNEIEDALSEVEIDETDMAKKLASEKSYKWEKYKGREKQKKMSDYLARKGFGWDVIKSVLKDI